MVLVIQIDGFFKIKLYQCEMGKFEVQFVLNSFKFFLGTVVNSLFYNFLQEN